ncbi:MAG: alkaline phosphatase D family protein [Actinomycetota bacterium]|nr:alkaline phosphatase D family protein [Actinomycetota bacterium]
MPRLVLGPLLRHIGRTDASIWVETDSPCEVEVLGSRAPTFHVAGHHYAIVVVEGLAPGGSREYEVALDGEKVWPDPSSPFPASTIRTFEDDHDLRILFGSCRVSAPHEPPYTLSPDEDERGRGPDALLAYTLRMLGASPERWPHAILFLGDQVYADEVSPSTLEFIRSRRDTSRPPHEEVADFEEYTRLYWESWQDPAIRWFLSTVSSAMVFDDHDVHDDWNISHQWVERMRREPWWEDRVAAAFSSYWVYQHLGNLSPEELRKDELLAAVAEVEDAAPLLREFALAEDRTTDARRWSFCRDLGRTRVVVIDCRAGRILHEGRRQMIDDAEWEWLRERTNGDFDHLLIGMSDPYLLAPAIHHAEAWNEAVCDGVWGRRFVPIAERIREAADLDHWASFRRAFERLTDLIGQVGAGERGAPPASIVALSGDVHNAYLADVAFPTGANVRSRVYQAVCSPIRNPLTARQRRAQSFGTTGVAEVIGRALAAAARVPPPEIRWRFLEGPLFENHLATLELDGRAAVLRLERATPGDEAGPTLTTVFERRLA